MNQKSVSRSNLLRYLSNINVRYQRDSGPTYLSLHSGPLELIQQHFTQTEMNEALSENQRMENRVARIINKRRENIVVGKRKKKTER